MSEPPCKSNDAPRCCARQPGAGSQRFHAKLYRAEGEVTGWAPLQHPRRRRGWLRLLKQKASSGLPDVRKGELKMRSGEAESQKAVPPHETRPAARQDTDQSLHSERRKTDAELVRRDTSLENRSDAVLE